MTRRVGTLLAPLGAGISDHACWAYDADEERATSATAWLAEGLDLGQRAFYVADADPDALLAELAGLGDVDALVGRGALVVAPSTAMYDLSVPIDPPTQLAAYAGAVDQAIADGYRGVRVAADITPLVDDPARRSSHARWEQYADRYIATNPLAPLCLYDTRRITGIDAIVGVHPLQGPADAMFAVYADGASGAVVSGEIDGCVAPVLTQILAGLPDADATLDVSTLRFVDAVAARSIRDALERRRVEGRTLRVSGAAEGKLGRVWQLCGFEPALVGMA